MSNPWEKYLPKSGDRPKAFKLLLEVNGEEHELIVTEPSSGLAKLPEGVPVIGSHELKILETIVEQGSLDPEMSSAILRVKAVLGGEIVSAKKTKKAPVPGS